MAVNRSGPRRPITQPPRTRSTSNPGNPAQNIPGRTGPYRTGAIGDVVANQQARGPERAQIGQFAQTQAANATSALSADQMTQEQKYDYLQKLTVQQAGGDESAWKTGDREVNLVGIRSLSDNKATGKGGNYDDTIYVARIVDGKKQVEEFKANVDSGKLSNAERAQVGYYDKDGTLQGATNLADGFYRDAFKRGEVIGDEFGLRQQGLVRLQADQNNDGIIQDSEKLGDDGRGVLAGARAQIQFHRGGDQNSTGGCQGIRADQYDRFQDILAEAPDSQDAKGQGGFSYLLTDVRNLPPTNSDFKALTRDQVDQRTAFQNHQYSLGDGDNRDPSFERGLIEEGADAINNGRGNRRARIREYSTDRSQENQGGGWLADLLRAYTEYGAGRGIIRTPYKSRSFRNSRFSRWLSH